MLNIVPPQRNSTPLPWEMLHCAGCPHIPDTHEAELSLTQFYCSTTHTHNLEEHGLTLCHTAQQLCCGAKGSELNLGISKSLLYRRLFSIGPSLTVWAGVLSTFVSLFRSSMVTMVHCFWVKHLDLLSFSVLIRCTSPRPAVQDLLKLLPSASAHHYEPAHARKTPCSSGPSYRSIQHIDSRCQTK